uniref:NEDD4-binding protein 2-like 2 n=1 Tax=Salarias fasciatus TaxID=181472 RepID=A0A672JE48_SALFA
MQMSQPESSLTPDPTKNEPNAQCQSSESSSSDGSERERVLKEVGLTSTAFIGPAFPPQTDAVKSDIEDSLSEFYKELKEIEPPDSAETGQDDPPLKTPPSPDAQDGLEENDVDTRRFDEADGFQKRVGRKHTWSHWYQNEPYYPRRPRPEFNSAPPETGPPDYRFPRPPFPHHPPSPASLHPQHPPAPVDPSFGHPRLTSHPPHEPYFPPPDGSRHPSCDFHRDSSGHRYEQRLGSDSHSDPAAVSWSRQGTEHERSEHFQRFDSLDDVWERRHHSPTRDRYHDPSAHPDLVLILMRGLPGSGKSTRARCLLSTGPSGVILSTDDYFADDDGYHFEPGLLGAAHEWNQRRAKHALFDGCSPVIIDNTNLQAWEMKPYVQMVGDDPDTQWTFTPSCFLLLLPRRNKHGVPQEKILQMLERFSSPVSVDAVLNSEEPSHVQQPRPPPPSARSADT